MKKLFTILALLSFNLAIAADNVDISWAAPTQAIDGSPLTGENALTSYEVYQSTSEITEENPGVKVEYPPDVLSTNYNLTGGSEGFTYYFRIKACNIGGCSAFSNQASKFIIADANPNPPTLIMQDTVVYTIVKRVDGFLLLPVGTAPLGTACIYDQEINGYNVIPRAVVNWSGNIQPDVVVAQCSRE